MTDFPKKERYLKPCMSDDLKQKMILLDGPRQVGKTTLARSLAQKKEKLVYLNYDNTSHRRQLLKMEWEGDADLLALDELHKYSKWKSFLKGIWDTRKAGEKIIVTGSSKLDVYRRGENLLERFKNCYSRGSARNEEQSNGVYKHTRRREHRSDVAIHGYNSFENAPGRYHHYRLHPFSLRELAGKFPRAHEGDAPLLHQATPLDGINDLMTLGGFPEPLLSGSQRSWRRWGKERFERVFREDIRDTSSIQSLGQLELLGQLLPARVASPLSMQSLSEDLDVSAKTVKEWIGLLCRNYYIFHVPPWHRRLERALKKESKYYLWDWSQVPEEGPRFENLVSSHLLKYCQYYEDAHGYDVKLYYLRDTLKKEVDFLIVWQNKPWLMVECKCKPPGDPKHLNSFADRLGVKQRFIVCLEEGINHEDRMSGVRTMSASRFLAMLV